ncbi:hypothetical protein PIB30_010077 [Stylosanthes scabra]|uniref:Uncharacterized protein n=1 Tax=Stylosanthes scabra TaxID=79078 RepID=A0ABU6X560_9FABA|nr:hypothetical protein [Stylosanthes scabra]
MEMGSLEMVKGSSIYRCWNCPMRTHRSFICVRIGAEISNWACRPRSDAYAWRHVMRTDRLRQWPSRFCCDLFVLFALFGNFRSIKRNQRGKREADATPQAIGEVEEESGGATRRRRQLLIEEVTVLT